MPTGKLASLALRAARPRLMSVTRPSSMTFLSALHRLGNKRFQHQQRGCRDHRRATIEPASTSNSSVVSSVGGGSAESRRRRRAHCPDDPVDLVQRQRRRRQHGGPVGAADGVAQLRRHRRPRRVAVAAMQIRAPQAAGHTGNDQRADQPGAVAHPHRQVRAPRRRAGRAPPADRPPGSPTAPPGRSAPGPHGVRLAAVRDPRTRTAQRAGQQIRQRAAAMDPDRRGARCGACRSAAVTGHRRRPVEATSRSASRRSGPADRQRRAGLSGAAARPGGGAQPAGGRTNTARRGSQPTCTAPSGRSSTGIAGLSM